MEVKSNVSLYFFALSNVVRDKHVLIAVDPNGLRVNHFTNLVDALRHPRIKLLKRVPLIRTEFLVVALIHEVMHVRSN